jgi:diguanylate cyclase (GGDEF)-like protein/PAS domain S-box-containing protein
MSVAGVLSLLFAFAALLLLVLNLMQRRELKAVYRLTKEIQSVSIGGRLGRRLDYDTDNPELAALLTAVNHLILRTGKPDVQAEALAEPQLFAALGDRLHEVVIVHGDSILYSNPQFANLLGVARGEVLGRRLQDLVPPDQSELVATNLKRALAGEGGPSRFEVDLIGMQGQLSRLEVVLAPTEFEGTAALLITAVEVIPTQTLQALSLPAPAEAPRARARLALDCLGEALLTVDTQGVIDYANPAAVQLLGLEGQEPVGRTIDQVINLVEEGDRRLLRDPVEHALRGTTTLGIGRRAFVLARGAGAERSIELSASPLRSFDNATEEITGAVLLLHDVTEMRGLTRQMSYQATHDALTGLVNRREFERRLAEAIELARSGEQSHVLCYVDLDRFKAVNDSGGHQAGDSMLREIAKLMRGAVRDSDTVGRLGGDEFALLLVGCPLRKGRQIADDLTRSISEHRFVWKDRIHQGGASIGLVEIGRDSGSMDEAIAAADSACYVAKKQGSSTGGNVAVYSARDEAAARLSGEIHWPRTLQNALRNNLFRLYWQPIVPAHGTNGDGPAMEVLVRLADERGQELSPMELVRAAERYRMMGLVDRWVVQTTLTALGRGAIELAPNKCLAINISGQTLSDAPFLEFVVEAFDQSGVDPVQVCFEISEASVAANLDAARRFVGVLHGIGCKFALDDFGSNLGSFSSLKNLPMDYLKIDGSFMRNLARDSVNQAMVAATIKLARSLNFKVIAEQVEDASGLDAARSMGVDYLQGYAIARPRPLSLAA